MTNSTKTILGIVALLVVCLCCVCVIGIAFSMIAFPADIFGPQVTLGPFPFSSPSPTPVVVRPTSQPGTGAAVSTETLRALEDTIIPANDVFDVVLRLKGIGNIPSVVEGYSGPRQVGEADTFWVSDSNTNEYSEISATLRYVGEHAYFWVEDGVSYRDRDVADLVDLFDQKIVPTNREFFGSEFNPGIDGDPRLYIVYAKSLGGSTAGYFSSADSYHPLAQTYSNAHEMFFLSAYHVNLSEDFAYTVLAHEYQHMIHWYQDLNEETWLNEGFSELAAFLNGYDVGGTDYVYSLDPDIQLNTWPSDATDTGANYGSSFLFVLYFLDRFGEDATKALVANPENGMTSVTSTLEQIGAVDPMTGQPITADDVFLDWVLASFMQDSAVGDGRYTYHNYPRAPKPSSTETISRCPSADNTRTVSQYGVDYIRIECQGANTLRFEGSTEVRVLPENAYSGRYAFWSNRADESDTTLTQTFDFSGHAGPLTLSFWTWYNIEEGYDYLYLVASEDGETWQILTTPSGTGYDPAGSNYGWGYNGASGGGPEWIFEEVDISQFAGKQVQLRFEYITDAAVIEHGFLLDDVSIPEIGYFSDFETDNGGWEPAGWVRMDNLLPQTFRLALIFSGSSPRVEYIELNSENSVDIPINLGSRERVVLVVSGTAPFTTEKAPYRFSIQP
jgi:immune inhibitor A